MGLDLDLEDERDDELWLYWKTYNISLDFIHRNLQQTPQNPQNRWNGPNGQQKPGKMNIKASDTLEHQPSVASLLPYLGPQGRRDATPPLPSCFVVLSPTTLCECNLSPPLGTCAREEEDWMRETFTGLFFDLKQRDPAIFLEVEHC